MTKCVKLQRKNRGSGGEPTGKCFGFSEKKVLRAKQKKQVLRAKDYRRAKRGPKKKWRSGGEAPGKIFGVPLRKILRAKRAKKNVGG